MAYILPRKDEHVFHDMDGAAGLLPSRREYENEENSEKNDVYSDREINLDLADEIETLETQSQTTLHEQGERWGKRPPNGFPEPPPFTSFKSPYPECTQRTQKTENRRAFRLQSL